MISFSVSVAGFTTDFFFFSLEHTSAQDKKPFFGPAWPNCCWIDLIANDDILHANLTKPF
jgi:hypothetical protein